MAEGAVVTAPQVRNLIGGSWRDGEPTEVRYPLDGRVVAEVHQAAPEQVVSALTSAERAWPTWRHLAAYERCGHVAALAEAMSTHAAEMAETISWSTGKLLRESRSEVDRAVYTTRVSAEEGRRVGGEIIPMDAAPAGAGKLGFAVREPLGVIVGITPFNSPLGVLCHKVGPALAAGNTVVVKPHLHGSPITAFLGRLAIEVGLPAGVLNVVHGGAEVGQTLVSHPSAALVSFTGSGRVAELVLRAAGLKRTIMELGGNAPTIVHNDADVQRSVAECVGASFALSGQSCVSTQRIYVHREIYDAFTDAFVDAAARLTAGDPFDPNTGIGPVIDEPTAARIESWIADAVAGGARVACGGSRKGALIPPTVILDARPEMKVVCEEVFGPVVSIIAYELFEEAIAAANESPWGFKSGVFTNSLSLAVLAARELRYGTVNINGPSRSRVDHEPSGGTRLSGWGREGPKFAIEDMTNLKMVTLVSQ